VPFWRLHIAGVSAKALPYAFKELDLLGDRQSLNLDINGHGNLL
jgi:hypothetical protein